MEQVRNSDKIEPFVDTILVDDGINNTNVYHHKISYKRLTVE